MNRHDLTATSWFTSRAGALLLAVVGVFFLFRPDWLGWSWLADALGGETALVSVGVGCAFFLCASLAIEKDQLRVHAAETMESLHTLLFGKSYKQDREAIEILLDSLENADSSASDTAHAHLRRLTGQNFAKDPKVWRSWWTAHQKTWSRRGGGETGSAQDDAAPDVEAGGGTH
jgi:hypothetical protein